MAILSDLYSYLIGESTVTDLVSTRIRPNRLPQGLTFPAVTYHRVSTPHDHNLDGGSGWVRIRLQVDVWDNTYKGVEDVAEALRGVLQGYQGSMGSTYINGILLDNEVDMSEAPKDGSDKWVHHRAMDFIILARESIPSP